MASFAVEKFGTDRLQEVTQSEMTVRIQDFKELTAFEVEV
jgi:hypothetical protein